MAATRRFGNGSRLTKFFGSTPNFTPRRSLLRSWRLWGVDVEPDTGHHLGDGIAPNRHVEGRDHLPLAISGDDLMTPSAHRAVAATLRIGLAPANRLLVGQSAACPHHPMI